MTDYEKLMSILNVWIKSSRPDVDTFYKDEVSPNGGHWVTVFGEDMQGIEFDFNQDGKIMGWF